MAKNRERSRDPDYLAPLALNANAIELTQTLAQHFEEHPASILALILLN